MKYTCKVRTWNGDNCGKAHRSYEAADKHCDVLERGVSRYNRPGMQAYLGAAPWPLDDEAVADLASRI